MWASRRPGDHAEKALVAYADPMIGPQNGPGGPNDTGAPSRPRHTRLSLENRHSPVRNAYRDILLFLYPLVMPHNTTLSRIGVDMR